MVEPNAAIDPLLGIVLNDYVIDEVIGEGGMGRVYLARHCRLGMKRVIKVLLPEVASMVFVRERFEQEAKALAKLSHSNIVRIEDYGTVPDGRWYLGMEYLRGESLVDYLDREGPMTAHQALYVLGPVLSALQYAHEVAHIVHRDLKPSNIFLTSDGRVVVLDLGLAKHLDGDGRIAATKTGFALGTPLYMPPEQFDDSSRVTAAADIFALAVCLWQMLVGAPPWGWLEGRLPFRAQLERRPSPPPEDVMPDALYRALLWALEIDPAERPTSVREFAVAVASAIPPKAPYPGGAEVLHLVAPKLVEDVQPHEMTLRGVASQERIARLLWPSQVMDSAASRSSQQAIAPNANAQHPGPVRAVAAPSAAAPPGLPTAQLRHVGGVKQAITRAGHHAVDAETPIMPDGAGSPARPAGMYQVPIVPVDTPTPAVAVVASASRTSRAKLAIVLLPVALIALLGLVGALIAVWSSSKRDAPPVAEANRAVVDADAAPPAFVAPVAPREIDAGAALPVTASLDAELGGAGSDARIPEPAPKEPPPRARFGKLQILSQGLMEVKIDGRHYGSTPVNAKLSAGKHTLILEDPIRHKTKTTTVTITAGEETSLTPTLD